MRGKQKTELFGPKVTVWIMSDLAEEPRQYQLRLGLLKFLVVIGIIVPILLGLVLAVNIYWSSRLVREKAELSELANRYHCTEGRLQSLSIQVAKLEEKTNNSYRQTRRLVDRMEKDLRDWLPEGAVGGLDETGDTDGEAGIRPSLLLTPSQFEKVNRLEQRLGRLEHQLELYERTLRHVEGTWYERDYLFAHLPTIWPLKEGRITSKFGMRIHPISRRVQMHKGIDLAAPEGTTIYATAPGTVVLAGRENGYGLSLEIDHGYGITSFYAHCSALLVAQGAKVKMGQKVARVGSTGMSTGPHLHFEVRVMGQQVNPMDYLSVFTEPPEKLAGIGK